MNRFLLIAALLSGAWPGPARGAGPLNLIVNPSFERGARGWKGAWRETVPNVVTDESRARAGRRFLALTADGANAGVDGVPLRVGSDFDAARPHRVAACVANQGIAHGGFGLRFYCYDARGRILAMKSVGGLGPASSPSGWRTIEAAVGPQTDFPFPDDLDHVVVRVSFWAEDGNCRGTVLVDDVFFGPAEGEPAPRPRRFERCARGTVAVWSDAVPGAPGHGDPEWLASLLREAGFGAHLLTTDEFVDAGVLRTDCFDLVILPYGAFYPAEGADALRRFLRSGGALITLGGPCFRRPLYRTPDGWTDRVAQPSATKPPRPVVVLSAESAASLAKTIEGGPQPGEVSLVRDDEGRPALRVELPHLETYEYVRFPTESTAEYGVLRFRARGDEATRHLCIETNESDGSRWKAVVDLSTGWRTYEIAAPEFVAYATEHRGDRGDYFHPERVRRVAFGFPASLVGRGPRAFEISQIAWCPSSVTPEQFAAGSMRFSVSTDLVRAFGSELKNADRGGDVTAFFNAPAFRGPEGLRAAADQFVFPPDLETPDPVVGFAATLLEDNALLLYRRTPTAARPFLPTERLARAIPLLVTERAEPAGSLFVHTAGPYRDTVWACFGVTDRDLFARGDRGMGRAFVALVERMLGGASLATVEPRFDASDGHARMRVYVEVLHHGLDDVRLDLHCRLTSPHGGPATWERTSSVELGPGQSRETLVLEARADQFDWKRFRVECRLVDRGRVVDVIRTSVDVRSVLEALCDRFVRTQRERGDGKISGVGFVDNRGVRALLAAYDVFGKREYVETALRWGEATLAEQRDDGGYLMGYGNHPEGDECYVADGGEIACAIARLADRAPEADRERFADSLNAYMAYRDSFRCEGGGIGVGWSKSDYGVRPIRRLDKITKIFAPELNIYTIGCTLAAAAMHARRTGDPDDHAAAVRDAFWWMERCERTQGGAFVESAVWAHKLLEGDEIRRATEDFLCRKFIAHVVEPGSRWWAAGGGRTVQGIEGLAYYHEHIRPDPRALAALMRATYHVGSPESLAAIWRVLAKDDPNADEWRYLHFASISLARLVEAGP